MRGGGGAVGAERSRGSGGGALRPRLHQAPRRVRPRRRLLHRLLPRRRLEECVRMHLHQPLVTIIYRRDINFQLILLALAFSGVFLAERLNTSIGQNWKSFSSQN